MSDVVSLAQVVASARAGALSLAPESVGYLALELVEALASARGRGPGGPTGGPGSGAWNEEHTRLRIDGTFAVAGGKADAASPVGGSAADDESRARRLFAELLEHSSGHAPALTAIAARLGGEGLEGLRSELEAALIPLNRAAGRRALARLAREVLRNPVRIEGSPAPPIIAPDPDNADTDPLEIPPVHEASAVPAAVALTGLPAGERPLAGDPSPSRDVPKADEASDWEEAVAAAASDEPPLVRDAGHDVASRADAEPEGTPTPPPAEKIHSKTPRRSEDSEPAAAAPPPSSESDPGEPIAGPAAHEPAPEPASREPAPEPASLEPASEPASGEPALEPAPVEPASEPASGEPALEPAPVEPASEPATVEPAPEPASVEPAPEPAASEPAGEPTASRSVREPEPEPSVPAPEPGANGPAMAGPTPIEVPPFEPVAPEQPAPEPAAPLTSAADPVVVANAPPPSEAPGPPSDGPHRERQPTLLGLAPSGRADRLIAELGSARSRDEMRVADDLKRSVGLEPTPRPPPASGSMRPASREESAIDEVWDSLPPPPPSAVGSASTRRSSSWESDPAPPPSAASSDDADDIAALSGRRRGRGIWIVVLMVAAIAGAVAWFFGNDIADTLGSNVSSPSAPASVATNPAKSDNGSAGASGENKDNQDVAPASPSAAAPAGSREPCAATVVLDGVVPGVEILVRAGAAPTGLPDNVLEGDDIVVAADGFAPRRHRVPAVGAATSDAPRELSVKLERAPRSNRAAPLEPWPPAREGRPSAKRRDEPRTGSQESPGGRYRVVTKPPNAEVWLSLGRGSSFSIGGLTCGAPVDLLVAGERRRAPPRRLTVPASALAAPPGGGPAVVHFSVAP